MLEAITLASLVWLVAGAILSGVLLGDGVPDEEWLGYVVFGPISWCLMGAIFLADWIHDKVWD